jgi:hypothetical protein
MRKKNLKSEFLHLKLLGLLVLIPVVTQAQQQQIRVGYIEYFGTKGIAVETVKKTLPFHEGDEVSFDKLPDLILKAKEVVKQSIGETATDVAPICCDDHDRWMVYVGLPGRNLEVIHYDLPPKGAIHFPAEVLTLYRQTIDLVFESVHAKAIEDRSQGYALSAYPPLRAKQLAMREYATRNVALIRRVLNEAADSYQRAVAAELLGYAIHNKAQIRGLVKASRDADEGVRNNAVRALGVLAESRASIAKQIPAAGFIGLLNSGTWTDRNKGGFLIETLTRAREAKLLRSVGRRASDSLLEMARWQEANHAKTARLILGRIAGIEENRLQKLVDDDPGAVIKAFAEKNH